MCVVTALLLSLNAVTGLGSAPAGDTEPLIDPTLPVTEIGQTGFTLQYFTGTPCPTEVQVREGGIPATAYDPDGKRPDPWRNARTVRAPGGPVSYHTVRIDGLKPGTRYFYRVSDPGADPTRAETSWGANPPWRREYGVSTLASKGRKTVIRLPVKVLLMTNVINVASAHDENGAIADPPRRLGAADVERIKAEFASAQRFFWINSGLRLWVDYRFSVDDRWQRWGGEPANAEDFYKGWPVSRAWAGVDFAGPGGGAFTILDTKNPLKPGTDPVYEEAPFCSQIEVAFLRYYDPKTGKWEWRNSGGGTYGVDGYPDGVPGRSQYLGGGDVCWLTTHEYHHQLESIGAFSLSQREDDRVVFDHFEPRRREVREDGSVVEVAWTTSGRHGEHYNGIAYWDRTLSDSQWLRFYFGETITVADADGDGVPDDDPRLPFDEKRFGSDPAKPMTDGRMGDLRKVMLSEFVPGPLQSMWTRGEMQYAKVDPHKPDSDGDGLPDTTDPYPLVPHPPLIYPMHAGVDGDPAEWADVPPGGTMRKGGMDLTFKQAYSDTAYYGLIEIKGPWSRIEVVQDGEGLGVFSLQGVCGFNVTPGDPVSVRPTWGEAPGLEWKAAKRPDGSVAFEFSYPNGGKGLWFWRGFGREIGTAIHVFRQDGAGYSVYETYEPFYSVMIERAGRVPIPPGAPESLSDAADAAVLKPGDAGLTTTGGDWKLEAGAYRYEGGGEDEILISGLRAKEFDLWVRMKGRSDGILAGFVPATRELDAGKDYVGFVGGYGNTVTKARLFGTEYGDDATKMTGEPQTIQFSRRDGEVWLMVDGKAVVWAADPNPEAVVDRLAVIGGYGGEQVVYEVRYRVTPPK